MISDQSNRVTSRTLSKWWRRPENINLLIPSVELPHQPGRVCYQTSFSVTWLPALWCFHCLQMECNHQCPDMCHSGSCPAPDTCDKKVYLRCACKRRKQEARCCDKRGGEKLECDEVCTKAQAQKKEVRSPCWISQLKNACWECEKFGCFS